MNALTKVQRFEMCRMFLEEGEREGECLVFASLVLAAREGRKVELAESGRKRRKESGVGGQRAHTWRRETMMPPPPRLTPA